MWAAWGRFSCLVWYLEVFGTAHAARVSMFLSVSAFNHGFGAKGRGATSVPRVRGGGVFGRGYHKILGLQRFNCTERAANVNKNRAHIFFRLNITLNFQEGLSVFRCCWKVRRSLCVV